MSQEKRKQLDALSITESLGFQTFRRESRKPWSKEEDAELVQVIEEMYPNQLHGLRIDNVKWDYVSKRVSSSGFRKAKDCRKRWTNSLDPNLRRGKWTEEEDQLLIKAHEKYGPSWQKVSAEIVGRTDDQCAKRYLEVLDPSTRDRLRPWTHEEDLMLIRQIKNHGTKWRTIAAEIPGRPSLTCRNRWRKLVTDVVRGKADPIIKREVDMITSGDLKKDTTQVPNKPLHQQKPQLYQPQPSQQSYRRPELANPVKSEVDWKYNLSGANNTSDLPHNKIFKGDHDGSIKNQELVHELVGYAKKHAVAITIHQHIHHHYTPPPPLGRSPTGIQRETSPFLPYNSLNTNPTTNSTMETFNTSPSVEGSYYPMDPETHITRYQHFNYLSPLTELPKLNSTYTSPNGSKNGSYTHQSPNQNQNQRQSQIQEQKDQNEAEVPKEQRQPSHHQFPVLSEAAVGGESEDASKPNPDLVNILNRKHENIQYANKPYHQEGEKQSNSLTPLTQAVQIAVAAEANGKRGSSSSKSGGHKRTKHDFEELENEEEVEEGLDFWETMRNLTDLPNYNNHLQQQQHQLQQQIMPNRNEMQSNQKPVSQHHPLHYFNSSATPQPEQQREEDEEGDEDSMNIYGLYYNVYTKEGSTNPEPAPPVQAAPVYENLNGFGMIPFNPS